MGKVKDLTGMTFNRLKVIRRVSNRYLPSGQSRSRWECDCSCGKKGIIVDGAYLRDGTKQSCGCLRKELARNKNKLYNKYDLSGDFGIGYTNQQNIPFYFDLEDYDLIKDFCWVMNNKGYVITGDSNAQFKQLHRMIMKPSNSKEFVDHINHNPSDNRKANLRICSLQQNDWNRKKRSDNTSGFTGVQKKGSRYIAIITHNKITYHLGSFDTPEEASIAYQNKAKELFGEYYYEYEA